MIVVVARVNMINQDILLLTWDFRIQLVLEESFLSLIARLAAYKNFLSKQLKTVGPEAGCLMLSRCTSMSFILYICTILSRCSVAPQLDPCARRELSSGDSAKPFLCLY